MAGDWLHAGKKKGLSEIPGSLYVRVCIYPGSRSAGFFLHQDCYKILVG